MTKRKSDFTLTTLDDLFTTQEMRDVNTQYGIIYTLYCVFAKKGANYEQKHAENRYTDLSEVFNNR